MLFWVSQVIKIIFLFVQDSSISYFIHCNDKTLDKSSLREESFVWAHGLRRDTTHHGREHRMAAHSSSVLRMQREMDAAALSFSPCFPFLLSLRIQSIEWSHPHLG